MAWIGLGFIVCPLQQPNLAPDTERHLLNFPLPFPSPTLVQSTAAGKGKGGGAALEGGKGRGTAGRCYATASKDDNSHIFSQGRRGEVTKRWLAQKPTAYPPQTALPTGFQEGPTPLMS